MTDDSGLRRKIASAGELRSVVRTMKALAASNIAQYEKSVASLADYVRAVEWGLGACLRQSTPSAAASQRATVRPVNAVIFGSDQGMVGPFNELITDHALSTLAPIRTEVRAWAVGERVQAALLDAGVVIAGSFPVPGSVKGITSLVGQILQETQSERSGGPETELRLFHNRPMDGATYRPVEQRLLPLDDEWRRKRMALDWPARTQPEIIGNSLATLQALIGEYLFVSLFRAGTESLASEQANRLASMQRAEHSIDDLLGTLHSAFHRLRQDAIDEELFDVIAGSDAPSRRPREPGAIVDPEARGID